MNYKNFHILCFFEFFHFLFAKFEDCINQRFCYIKNKFSVLKGHSYFYLYLLFFIVGVYPASPATWMFFLAALLAARYSEHRPTIDILQRMEADFPV